MAHNATRGSDDVQRLLAEQAFVRSLAQALAAPDPDDVVQQTWLAALQRGGSTVRDVRQWLGRIARNAAHNLRRGARRRNVHERDAAVDSAVPSSADLLLREERRRALLAAVDALPELLRAVVLLRWFEDLPPRAIAARLGVPVTTVWNRLRRALQILRNELDREYGDRCAWLLPLAMRLPDAVPGTPLLPLSSAASGVLVMTTKLKLAAAAGILIAGIALMWSIDWTREPAGGLAVEPPSPQSLAVGERSPVADEAQAAPQRALLPAPTAVASAASLAVHVSYKGETAGAADVLVVVARAGADQRVGTRRARSDASGDVRFTGLDAGNYVVWADHRGGKKVEVRAGENTAAIELRTDVTLRGIVVDSSGAPIAGAAIELAPGGSGSRDPETVATTGGDGRFAVRTPVIPWMIGARAAGFAASPTQFVVVERGSTLDLRFELREPAGAVEGTVVGPDGMPVAGAVVRVGAANIGTEAPQPANVHTDAQGRFCAVGIAAARSRVGVRAPGLAPWDGDCVVTTGNATSLRIQLQPGVTCRGTVRDGEGRPVVDASVTTGRHGELTWYETHTGADGAFRLDGLPPQELELAIVHGSAGKTTVAVHCETGGTVQCDVTLTRGLELRGRVLDAAGAPVAQAHVEGEWWVSTRKLGWSGWATTGSDGAFALANCPEGELLRIDIKAAGFVDVRHEEVDPRAGELVVRLQREPARTVRLRGRLEDPDGKPVMANVYARDRTQSDQGGIWSAADGAFELMVAPGRWRVQGLVPKLGWFVSEWRELADGGVWDLGTIRLAGGTLLVRPNGEVPAPLNCLVYDAADQFLCGLSRQDSLRSDPLSAGRYRLFVSGGHKATVWVPFTIASGAETVLDLRLEDGVRQRVELTVAGRRLPPFARLEVGRAGAPAWHEHAERDAEGRALAAELWLAPGDYTLTATAGAMRGEARFTIGPAEGLPVRFELR